MKKLFTFYLLPFTRFLPPSSGTRFPALDGLRGLAKPIDLLLILRGIACLMVVAGHSFSQSRRLGAIPQLTLFNYDASWLFFLSGSAGVGIFFTLSGYLMGKGFWHNRYQKSPLGFLNFYFNRILRICPLYFASAVVLLFFLPYTGSLLDLFAFSHSYGFGDFNRPLWSISTEVQFYLLVPIFALLFFRHKFTLKKGLFAISIILLLGIAFRHFIWLRNPHYNIYGSVWTNLPLFLAGFLANPFITAVMERKAKKPLLWVSISSVLLFSMLVFCSWLFLVSRADWLRNIAIMPLIASAVAFFIITVEIAKQSLVAKHRLLIHSTNLAEWAGKLSYGIYIWHWPVILFLSDRLPMRMNASPIMFVANVFCVITICITISTITYVVIERPFERMKIIPSRRPLPRPVPSAVAAPPAKGALSTACD